MANSSPPDLPNALFDAFEPVSDEEWLSTIRSDLRGTDTEDLLTWSSIEGIDQRAYYRSSDRDRVEHLPAVPIVRSDVAPANPWRTRVDIAHPDPDAAQRQVQDALDADTTDIGLSLHLADGALHGLPIQRLADLAMLLEDVDLTETAIHVTGGLTTLPVWAMLRTVADQRDVETSALQGSTDFDPVAALVQHQISTVDRAFDCARALVRTAADTPSAHLLSVDVRPYHDAGASAVQELGLALGALSETFVQLRDRGVALDDVSSTLQWIVPVDTSYFIAIAKLRALRLLIPQVLDAFDVDIKPGTAFIQAITSRRSETRYEPYVNLLRGTTEAVSAIIGGCDVLTVRPFTASFATPSDFAQRLARNTQHLLRAESHLDHVADPAAGSYYIEVMTDQLARKAWSLFQEIEAGGGMLSALRAGTVQQRIAVVRAERLNRIADRKDVLVGTNHYPAPEETRPPGAEPFPNGQPLERSDHSIARRGDLTLFDIRTALSDGATLGDVMDTLSGAGTPSFDPLPTIRLAGPFEAIRHRTEQWAEQHDGPPRVVLLPMGDPTVRSARATFARNMLGVAGFAIDEHIQFETPAAAAHAAAEAGAAIVVLCSSNDEYPTLAPALCDALDHAGIDPLVLIAGHLPEDRDELEAVGVDDFIHRDAPLLDVLADLQQRLGIDSFCTVGRMNE